MCQNILLQEAHFKLKDLETFNVKGSEKIA